MDKKKQIEERRSSTISKSGEVHQYTCQTSVTFTRQRQPAGTGARPEDTMPRVRT